MLLHEVGVLVGDGLPFVAVKFALSSTFSRRTVENPGSENVTEYTPGSRRTRRPMRTRYWIWRRDWPIACS